MVDLSPIARRYNLRTASLECRTAVRISFGTSNTDNRSVEFLLPRGCSTRAWTDGLRALLRAIKCQKSLTDQRTLWLKTKYLQLFYRSVCCTLWTRCTFAHHAANTSAAQHGINNAFVAG